MNRFDYGVRLVGLSALLAALTMATAKETVVSAFSLSVYLGYLALVSTLSAVSLALPWSLMARALTICVMVTGAMLLNMAVELSFFSVPGTVNLTQLLASGCVTALAGAFLVAWVFPPNRRPSSPFSDLRRYLRARQGKQWILLFFAAVLAYVFLYLTVGAAAYRFTEPFYNGGELGLVVPELQTVVFVQFLRGGLYVFSIWLFIAGSSYSRLTTAALCGLALFVLGGLTPLLLNSEWPLQLRVYHGIEIFFQNAVAGFVICLILGTHNDNSQQSSKPY